VIRTRLAAFTFCAVFVVALTGGAAVIGQSAQPTPSKDIGYGQSLAGQLDSDGTQDWHFVAAPGDSVTIDIVRASGNLVVGLSLQDSDGQSLAGAQATDSGNLTLTDVHIAQPGVYMIHVFSMAHTSGSYKLALSNNFKSLPTPTPIDQLLAGTITAGQTAHGAEGSETEGERPGPFGIKNLNWLVD